MPRVHKVSKEFRVLQVLLELRERLVSVPFLFLILLQVLLVLETCGGKVMKVI